MPNDSMLCWARSRRCPTANLNIPAGQDPLRRLHHLALRHRALTDLAANWQGTHIYAAERFLARQAKEG